MSNFLKKIPTGDVSFPSHKHKALLLYKFLYPIAWILVILAFFTGTFLLLSDVVTTHIPHMPLSAAPLLLIGAAYLTFQVLIRAQFLDLFKALIVSSAFILWGIDQLLPSGWLATTLGDIVIVLYIIDLGWMMMDRLKQQWQNHHAQTEKLADLHPSEANLVETGFYRVRASALQDQEALDKTMPLLLTKRTPFVNQPPLPPRFVEFSHGNVSKMKRNRLAPLPCTCTSPLAPIHSSVCCCSMKEVSVP